MTIRLMREPSADHATLGALYINGVWNCWTLEDVIREVAGQPVQTWKVKGQTAIPSGRYRIVLSQSRRFNRLLPELLDVPGFTGVRIHPGNTVEDTEGCLLPGLDRYPGHLGRSRLACERLIETLIDEPDETWIDIRNPSGE